MKLTEKLIRDTKNIETPALIMDLDIIENNYKSLVKNIDNSQIFFAVKANSHPKIVERLVRLGSSFDVASIGELDLVLSKNADVKKISFGNTIKKSKHIKYAYEKGVRIFVADEFLEIDKIAINAPNSKLFVRMQMSDSDSDWPLTKKFGTNIEKAKQLLIYAKEKGVIPYGISFHVGSQCYDKYIWKTALLKTKDIFDELREEGINLKFINTGGGMPIKHIREIPTIEEISDVINDTIKTSFEEYKDLIVAVEPGRSMVGNAGILISEVILRSEKEKNEWLYIDSGVFHGLMETSQGFKYEIIVPNRAGELCNYTLSGPTCDSVDTMYENIQLPDDIEIGDRVYFINAGAYTTGYASNFNGIEPPKIYFLDEIL
ncbi:type III PLP-dependent enzyme [Haliovirga abyssi]|uniref:ornithine decarboxylase n=1 Tax=Haliovirga abyssi TaxID=2996794 RepID=A0AAU9D2W6_9FUSO|nr:type III PLP-dependent enzyme [Haliovirga abyssi]BDU50321.1 ornithine decarboxylase [Haliovirga abyssi]